MVHIQVKMRLPIREQALTNKFSLHQKKIKKKIKKRMHEQFQFDSFYKLYKWYKDLFLFHLTITTPQV